MNQTFNLCHTYVRATMGVSYAAPAYYADRLCERARCYLRDFFAPTQHKREELDKKRWGLEKKYKLLPPKTFDKKAEDKKTKEQKETERAVIKEAKEKVEEALKECTRKQVEERLDGDPRDEEYNPERCEAVSQT
jgi:eukaryotic translation initiation factor 2C